MLNVTKANFAALRKLSVSDRLSAFNDAQGKIVFSALTPTQFAELFPRYYRENLPDISGFMKALPSSLSAARQKYYEQAIQNTAAASKDGRTLSAWQRKWSDAASEEEQKAYVGRKDGRPAPEPPASFTPEEQKAWDALQKGPISAGSAEAKALSSLSGEVLAKYGIEKFKDQNGQDMIRYNAPQATREEAEKALKQGQAGSAGVGPNAIANANMAKQIYDYLRQKGVDHNHAAGILANIQRESKFNPGAYNPNDINGPSGGLFQHHSKFSEGAGGRFNDMVRHVGPDWKSNWKKQIDFALNEGEMKKYLGRPVNSVDEAQQAFVQDFEKPKDSSGAAAYNRRFISSIESVVSGQPIKPEGPNGQYSDKQIADMQEKIKGARTEEEKQGLMRKFTEMHRSRGEAVPGMGDRVGAVPSAKGTTKWDAIQPMGGSGYCGRGVADLARKIYGEKHGFNGHLGTNKASDLAYGEKRGNNIFVNSGMYRSGQSISKEALTPEFLNSLPPGTIVANGGGGISRTGALNAGHIQMKLGNRWASDHNQRGGFLFGANRDNGEYRDFVIYYPSDQGNKFLYEKGLIENIPPQAMAAEPPKPVSPPPVTNEQPELKNDPYSATDVGVAPAQTPPGDARGTEQVQPLHADTTGTAQQRQVSATGETATATPAQQQATGAPVVPQQQAPAAPAAPAAQQKQAAPNRFKVNQAGLIAAIKNTDEFKNTFGSSFATDNMILEGFANDSRVKDAGVTYDPVKGTMHIKDPNDPRVKKAMEGLDTKSFMTPIEEKKKKEEAKAKAEATPAPQAPAPTPEVKPLQDTTQPAPQNREVKATDVPKQGEKPKAEAAPTPQAPTPPPAQTPAAPAPEKKEADKPTPPKNKTGGKVRVDEGMTSVPITPQDSDPRSDNMLAINPKSQESLFTYNNKERLAYSPTNDQVQIVPENKIGTQQDPITASAQATNKIQGPITATPAMQQTVQHNMQVDQNKNTLASDLNASLSLNYNRDPDMIHNMMQHSGVIAKSPSAERAFSRVGFAETGGGIGGKHFSYGTSSIT